LVRQPKKAIEVEREQGAANTKRGHVFPPHVPHLLTRDDARATPDPAQLRRNPRDGFTVAAVAVTLCVAHGTTRHG
jgi:hypothetical protein